MNKNRLEAFSDGVIAIIITIIVLDIPMPESIDKEGILNLVINLGIFFIAFMVIGAQWVKHHMLFSFSKTVSIKVVWRKLNQLIQTGWNGNPICIYGKGYGKESYLIPKAATFDLLSCQKDMLREYVSLSRVDPFKV